MGCSRRKSEVARVNIIAIRCRRWVASTHRESEKGSSRKPDFRHIRFSELGGNSRLLCLVLLTAVCNDIDPCGLALQHARLNCSHCLHRRVCPVTAMHPHSVWWSNFTARRCKVGGTRGSRTLLPGWHPPPTHIIQRSSPALLLSLISA